MATSHTGLRLAAAPDPKRAEDCDYYHTFHLTVRAKHFRPILKSETI